MTYFWSNTYNCVYIGDMQPGDREATPEEIDAHINPPLTIADYENAVQNHIDEVAQKNDFDNIQTCTKYAGFDNAFRAHAEALLAWNANCWINCHTIMDAVNAGTMQPPTIAELLAELPAFVWNNN